MRNLPKIEVVSILSKVKEVSETHRNPEWKDNAKRMKGGKVCNSAAGPRDLGADRRNQSITRKMEKLVEFGHLTRVAGSFPWFTLTDEGTKYLAENEKKKKK